MFLCEVCCCSCAATILCTRLCRKKIAANKSASNSVPSRHEISRKIHYCTGLLVRKDDTCQNITRCWVAESKLTESFGDLTLNFIKAESPNSPIAPSRLSRSSINAAQSWDWSSWVDQLFETCSQCLSQNAGFSMETSWKIQWWKKGVYVYLWGRSGEWLWRISVKVEFISAVCDEFYLLYIFQKSSASFYVKRHDLHFLDCICGIVFIYYCI